MIEINYIDVHVKNKKCGGRKIFFRPGSDGAGCGNEGAGRAAAARKTP